MKWLIVGLGNPGTRYQQTRHNAGFVVVDRMIEEKGLVWKGQAKWEAIMAEDRLRIWVKPQTFMNLSGKSVVAAMREKKIQREQLIVIHDDLDLPLGTAKVSFAKGPHGHNGIASVETELKTQQFWRVRVGVESRSGEERRAVTGERYVLSPLDYEANKGLIVGRDKAMKAVDDIMKGRYAIPGETKT